MGEENGSLQVARPTHGAWGVWECGSTVEYLLNMMGGPEFDLQHHQKKLEFNNSEWQSIKKF